MRYFFLFFLFLNLKSFAVHDFEKEMGKGSPSWEYLQTQEDRENLTFYKTLYERMQKASLKGEGIAATIHFIWLGPKDFPQSSVASVKEWMAKHPGWRFCFWTDIDRAPPCAGMEKRLIQDFHFQYLEKQYDLSENYLEKTQLLRYELLFQEGGICADHEAFPLKSFEKLNKTYDFYCGLEPLKASFLSSSVMPASHLIAAKQHHPILEMTLKKIVEGWEGIEASYPGSDTLSVVYRMKQRAAASFEEAIKAQASQHDTRDIVFPAHFFSSHAVKEALYLVHTDLSEQIQTSEWETKMRSRLEHIEKREQRVFLFLVIAAAASLFVCLRVFGGKKGSSLSLILLALLFSCEKQHEESSEFDRLMGKKTEHWKYIVQKEDEETLERCRILYEKNSPYLQRKSSLQKIPNVIHFIWLGPKPYPAQSVENIRTWLAKNPGWKIKFWTDRDRPSPCKEMERHLVQDFHFSFLGKEFDESENYAEKSDILRFEILYREGGGYADHDANCLVSFERLHENFDFYCGLEAPHPPFVGLNVTCGIGVLGSRPGHPIVKQIIDLVASRWEMLHQRFKGKDPFSKEELVMQRTYIPLTHALKEGLEREGNVDIVLPAAYFFAKSGIEPIYSKHFYATLWGSRKERRTHSERQIDKILNKIQQRTKNLNLISLFIIFFNLTLVSSTFYKKR
jgi:mannosyltransferase OCH1-like enzyme